MKPLWKVLITDDEPIIREGIRESVDWEALGMQVAAEAEDGEEALELALKHEVHLVLADLNMPIMDGITFIKEMRNRRPECKVIIVTGHDEFTYAQEAIRLHVAEYILKPAEPEQLRKVLEKVGKELEDEYAQEQHLQLASRQITRNFPLLRERFCLEWVEDQLASEEIAEQLQFLQLPAESPHTLGMIRWAEPGMSSRMMPEKDRQLFLFAVENIATEYLLPWRHVTFRDSVDLLVFLIWGDVPAEVFSQIDQSIKRYLKIHTTQHFEPVRGGLTGVPEAYRQAKSELYKQAVISPIARRAKQIILEQYGDKELSLERTAQMLQVSPVYLSRVLKQELGSTFVALLTETRIKKAIQLLNASDLPIHEIAERVGYDTQHYFSTAFKKATGVSPLQYRRGGLEPQPTGE
ncbi:response regulator [Paenibacillus hamazuiensis]|uniref:response regulator n=1 Tax=Paenibacillus hamazuiensis TaxID=2936508 RepID=UPI00201045BA|nr:response regulator [Paenibacillus hamazuiensis]